MGEEAPPCPASAEALWPSSSPLSPQSPVLQFHAGYQKADLAPVVRKLHGALAAPPDDKLRAIRNKYSHR